MGIASSVFRSQNENQMAYSSDFPEILKESIDVIDKLETKIEMSNKKIDALEQLKLEHQRNQERINNLLANVQKNASQHTNTDKNEYSDSDNDENENDFSDKLEEIKNSLQKNRPLIQKMYDEVCAQRPVTYDDCPEYSESLITRAVVRKYKREKENNDFSKRRK